MEKRTLGKTGLSVSVLGLGAAPAAYLGTQSARFANVLSLLLDAGVNLIDTAAGYPGSEQALGKLVGHRRNDFYLVSKCGHKVEGVSGSPWSASLIEQSIDRSLANLGITHVDVMLLHSSNLRPVKRIDLLLETVARLRPGRAFKLVILAGDSFAPFAADVRRLGLEDRVIVRERVTDTEDYLQAADVGLVTSESESFCLSILEAMCFGCPSVATAVGGIPEVVEDGKTGLLVPFGNPDVLARAVEQLIDNPSRRAAMGAAARDAALRNFSADVIVPRYEALYDRLCGERAAPSGQII